MSKWFACFGKYDVTSSGKRGRRQICHEDELSRFLRNLVKGTISYDVTSEKIIVFMVTAWINTKKKTLGSVNFGIFSSQTSDYQFLNSCNDPCKWLQNVARNTEDCNTLLEDSACDIVTPPHSLFSLIMGWWKWSSFDSVGAIPQTQKQGYGYRFVSPLWIRQLVTWTVFGTWFAHIWLVLFYLCLFSVFNHGLAMIWLLQQSRESHMASQHSGTRPLQQ